MWAPGLPSLFVPLKALQLLLIAENHLVREGGREEGRREGGRERGRREGGGEGGKERGRIVSYMQIITVGWCVSQDRPTSS